MVQLPRVNRAFKQCWGNSGDSRKLHPRKCIGSVGGCRAIKSPGCQKAPRRRSVDTVRLYCRCSRQLRHGKTVVNQLDVFTYCSGRTGGNEWHLLSHNTTLLTGSVGSPSRFQILQRQVAKSGYEMLMSSETNFSVDAL